MPTFEECLAAAYEEFVRSWYDEHCLWCGAVWSQAHRNIPCEKCAGEFALDSNRVP